MMSSSLFSISSLRLVFETLDDSRGLDAIENFADLIFFGVRKLVVRQSRFTLVLDV